MVNDSDIQSVSNNFDFHIEVHRILGEHGFSALEGYTVNVELIGGKLSVSVSGRFAAYYEIQRASLVGSCHDPSDDLDEEGFTAFADRIGTAVSQMHGMMRGE